MRKLHGNDQRLGQWLYGSFFVILLPALLALWAWRLDRSGMTLWPIPFSALVGVCLVVAGLFLMLLSMRALWIFGEGLPMNAYPPARYVVGSTYAIVSHPIYVGFIGVVGGVSIAMDSSAGLWVVTPVMVLATMALVIGYEGPRLRERFGDAVHAPLLSVPRNVCSEAAWGQRWIAVAMALGPWAALYMIFSVMPTPEGAVELRLSWDYEMPVIGWMIWIYSAAYPIAMAGPLLLHTDKELRHYVIGAWLATFFGFYWMLFIPGQAALLPFAGNELEVWLLAVNRHFDAGWLAFPSFHMIWVVFAAYCFQSRFKKMTPVWIVMVSLIGLSCMLTGTHAIVDVLGGLLLGMLGWYYEKVWNSLVLYAEILGNSWDCVQYGPVRIISHALWSFSAATVGVCIVFWLVGPGFTVEVSWVFGAALLAAGAWGHWLEGGTRLSRPFGYYGFLFGAVLSLAILAFFDRVTAQMAMAAFACGAPLAQAIGRLRCLVQGCCHGDPVNHAPGIRIINPKSRVIALGHLHGVPIHPTQLYSIASNLIIFVCLWRLWHWEVTATLIGGLYLALSSLARFMEERYRGEPQTLVLFGLPIYQWLAVILFIVGIIVSMIDSIPVQMAASMTLGGVSTALVAGLLAAFLMSVDFPDSQRRFSRLTVSES